MHNQETDDRRFELKYRIHYAEYLKVKNSIYAYMKKDSHTLPQGETGYFVRSLYFDSDDYRAYHEKMSGNSERLKLRIRTYDQNELSNPSVRIEIKMRKGNLVQKKSAFVSLDDCTEFLTKKAWKNTDTTVLAEFEKNVRSGLLHPKILIDYFREGYESRVANGLRITFDHQVRSASSKVLYPEKVFYRIHNPHFVIMEVKFKDTLPSWIKNLVHGQGLKVIANSKFTQGIQLSRRDLHHPGGIIIVR